jgi:D-alanyl-D-alanine carboxypeptidase/D-alanyl-D-alanine-endopeptidase (penicillin-binding protein 4)
VRIADGSGLSRLNRLTASMLVHMLRSAWTSPDFRDSFFSSLPVAARSGTLERRMIRTAAAGRVRAKTGTTRESSALSGIVKGRFAFSILQNGSPVAHWSARRSQDRFAAILAAN